MSDRDDILNAVERVAITVCTPGEFANVLFVLALVRELGHGAIARADMRATLASASLAELLAELQRRGAEA